MSQKAIIIGFLLAIVLFGGVLSFFMNHDKTILTDAPADNRIIQVYIPPPPPPLPPPPPPEIEPPPLETEPEMIEQEPVAADELPPDDSPAAPDEPAVDLGTGLVGDGPNSFGLTAGGGNRGGGTRQIGARAGGSRWGWYASRVQNSITQALANHSATRNAALSIQVRIWADRNGRVTRAELTNTSGDRTLDEIIRNQILTGLVLTDPPPDDMPMPINLRITARKP